MVCVVLNLVFFWLELGSCILLIEEPLSFSTLTFTAKRAVRDNPSMQAVRWKSHIQPLNQKEKKKRKKAKERCSENAATNPKFI